MHSLSQVRTSFSVPTLIATNLKSSVTVSVNTFHILASWGSMTFSKLECFEKKIKVVYTSLLTRVQLAFNIANATQLSGRQ